jgi:putative N6-adenine-specific DNA methylase
VLLRLDRFEATTFGDLFKRIRRLPWEEFLRASAALDVQAASHRSRLYIKRRIADVVAEGIGARVGFEPGRDASGLLILARLDENICEISVDTSGELLHRRGFRAETAKAPLRETLAAGCLLLAGYDPRQPLCDPMCGAGTIALEAALIAMRRAPGRSRGFAFMDFATLQAETWAALCADADAQALPASPAPILASDINAGAIRAARGNAERAGLANAIALEQRDLRVVTPPPGIGLVLCNPPYGQRIRATDHLYCALVGTLRSRFGGWRFGLLTPRETLFRRTGLRADAAHPLVNGGLKVHLFCGAV